jgi:anti-anti-sigma factor
MLRVCNSCKSQVEGDAIIDDLVAKEIQLIKNLMSSSQFSADHFSSSSASNTVNGITELFPRLVRMHRHMELKFQVDCFHDVAVVNCSGRMVRGPALEEFRRRIEQIERVRMLVLDVSEVEQLDAGGLGALLLVRGWATRNSANMKLVNPPLFFRRLLETTHLTSVFEISSLREAICILRSKECPPRFAAA